MSTKTDSFLSEGIYARPEKRKTRSLNCSQVGQNPPNDPDEEVASVVRENRSPDLLRDRRFTRSAPRVSRTFAEVCYVIKTSSSRSLHCHLTFNLC